MSHEGAAATTPDQHLTGIVLAAGAGRRRGMPKALVTGPGGPWLAGAVGLLMGGGCTRVVVVLGAAAEEARGLVPDDERLTVVVAQAWESGMGESLRAGLRHAAGDAAVITLVDLPGTPVTVLQRLLAGGVDAGTLRQAVYRGRPGHPVVLGRDHWAPLAGGLCGDRGARDYLVRHGVVEVECGDLHHGRDVDD